MVLAVAGDADAALQGSEDLGELGGGAVLGAAEVDAAADAGRAA